MRLAINVIKATAEMARAASNSAELKLMLPLPGAAPTRVSPRGPRHQHQQMIEPDQRLSGAPDESSSSAAMGQGWMAAQQHRCTCREGQQR